MSKHLSAAQTIAPPAPTLVHLQEAEANAAWAQEQGQELHRKTRDVLLTAQHQHLLALFEAEPLESLANAEVYPNYREHYLAEAEKRAKAATILGS
ncbi:hypothetical protein [Pseudomonas solani]|uniref:hypothetical protein n=1 Tax=Pseudomonas solani TaxID=2731552 RepID=UPI003C302D96